ncbi:cystathionine beta-lyase MetC [Staphylococcus argenteus]|uniref:cysteine-S-conjugate beta-lyase n=2 Tax=Staphylococcus TaxID=1279 RepID=A0A7U7JSH1_9STAP|nr:cystathionine beta-lyase MetC [Staphylococcus argenteus]BBN30663.1 bifunctional cystathionine gamma-lyase/gamma-synthase [Staphylococcus aureus]ATY56022.1 PLP-dependent transferase [Staphylococcus argenteus]ATZ86262.1 cystathionine gamma-synthase [Staphylococcus argenteus]EYG93335.1 trans-sulfuration enzyme family protein [Staphylococcus argenteus]EYL86781.1 trans-sulfuration enzyme family protein [Staphylococcus argenteus]
MTLSKETEVIFDWRRGVEYHSANPPLYDSSTFHQKRLGDNVKYDYARSGNPNRELLEEKLARLEHGKFAFAFASGIAAISAVLLTLKASDHVILPDDVYGGTFRLTEQILNRFNIEFTTVDTTKVEQIEGAIQSNTKLIYIETPSNPCFKITDIKAVSKIAKKHQLLVAVDNTFMTPLGQSPLLLGADIVIHSATKFLSGHSDLIAGAVITNNEAIREALYLIQNGTGNMLSAQDSWMLAKHLKTFPIRFKQSVENAQKIVSFLIEQEEISEVYYPGLNSAHLEQAENGGAVIGLRLKDESKAQQFVDALTLPLVSVSLGGIETILSHPATMSHAALPEKVREARGITFGLFRLSVGLEDPDELIADIKYALKEAFNESIPHTIER